MRRLYSLLALFVCLAGSAGAQSYAEMSAARDLLVAGDHAAALAVIEPAAAAGDARAMNLLGAAHQHGLGVKQEAGAALRYFNAAAEQGYPPAVYNLGVLYGEGMPGLAQDPAAARRWYARGRDLDYAPAIAALGVMAYFGEGGPADLAEAFGMFSRAAFLGDAGAINWLAYFHHEGIETPVDLAEARRLYEIAALMGETDAEVAVGDMYALGDGGPVELDRARHYFERSLPRRNALGIYKLGLLLLENPDLGSSPVESLGWCLWAARELAPSYTEITEDTCTGAAVGLTGSDLTQAVKFADRF